MTVFLEKKINMLKKITKRKLFLREFVRKSQWQGIYVGFEVRIVLTISSLSFFFFPIICQQLIVVLSMSGPPMRRWMNSEPLRIRSCWLFTNVLQWFDWNWKKQLLKNTATFRWKLSFLRTLFNQDEFGDVSFAF